MRRPPNDPPDMDRADLLRMERIGDIVLLHLARPEAGDIEETIID